MSRDATRALERGMTIRPLGETVEATSRWLQSPEAQDIPSKDFGNRRPRAGLTRERERELLDRWAEVQ